MEIMKVTRILPLCLATALILSALFLTGCQQTQSEPAMQTQPQTVPVTEPTVPETEPTEPPTEPQPTCPPDGDPNNVTSKGTYTGTPMEVAKNAETVVATVGEVQMNNALLQIYYRMAVGTYQRAAHEIAPDFNQPLDVQMCPLENNTITWQQYFLQQALNSWHSQTALLQRSKVEVLPLEEAYAPDEKKHKANLKTEIYNLDLLYGYNTAYKVADAHQEYLNGLPAQLEWLAAWNDCSTTAALANKLAGVGTNDTYLLEYARLLNEAYMFLTTLSYYIEPAADEVEAYFMEHEASYAEQGITMDDSYVNLRQILLVPDGATVADDGTVTASDSSWSSCKKDAESILKKWRSNSTETYFGELAYRNSQDTGSKGNGGLYTNITKGQLVEDLDVWCFDPSRDPGDTVIIRTSMGYHILYLCQPSSIWYEQAELDLIAKHLEQTVTVTQETYPMTVNYRSILLESPGEDDIIMSASDLLYPDIGHQRFPEAPLYFQQDYPNSKYGDYNLVTYGCGITTMAMLTTYMTDKEWTPPVMAGLYGSYCSKAGTAHSLFLEVPADRGFYCIKRTASWSEALEALENGYMVVTLQRDGFWTNGGHYLLLHNLVEAENTEGEIETRVQVRDSNILNYKKLKGHTSGSFALSTIPPNNRSFWIYQKKFFNVDACVRCAEPTEESYSPAALFTEGYVCPKCQTAENRRDAYIDACALVRIPVTSEEPIPAETVAATEAVPTETVAVEAVPTDIPATEPQS